MLKKIRYVAFDGPDGLGKTTQLTLLAKRLMEEGRTLHNTRLLGGDGTDEFQLAMRKVLLHPKFDAPNLETEEEMFAMTDLEGIKIAREVLNKDPQIIALKDRALGSHVAYALAKGMRQVDVERIHANVILAEKDIARRHGALHLLFIPDQIEWLLKRVAQRNAKDGTVIVERLENLDVQTKVVAALQQMPLMRFAHDVSFEHVQVKESDTISDVQAKVNAVLSRYSL